MNTPRLRMGLVGFSGEDYLLALLRTRSAAFRWEDSRAADADALWINGEAARLVHDGIVRLPAGREPAMTLDLQALDRPTCFTLPVADPNLRPPITFDPHSAASIDKALRRCEAVLHPLALELALAQEIAIRLPKLTGDTYHVTRNGRLAAIVNMGGAIGFDSELLPPQLRDADWRLLPKAASGLPRHFFATTFAEVLWRYVMRVDTDLLPERYRHLPIHFRAIPRVPQRVMKEVHYAVLSELGSEPQTFGQLQQNLGFAERPLASALAGLYYAGAITVDRSRAARGLTRYVREGTSPSELRHSMFPQDDSQPFSAYPGRTMEERTTVPAPLEPQPRGAGRARD